MIRDGRGRAAHASSTSSECELRYEPPGSRSPSTSSTAPPRSPQRDRSEIAAFVRASARRSTAPASPTRCRTAEVRTAVEQGRASFLSAMTHNLRTPLATIKTALVACSARARPIWPPTRPRARRHRVRGVGPARAAREQGARTQPHPGRRASSPTSSRSTSPRRPRARCNGSACSPTTARSCSTLPADLPLVRADPALLDVVLVNVLENALRYAPDERDRGPGAGPEPTRSGSRSSTTARASPSATVSTCSRSSCASTRAHDAPGPASASRSRRRSSKRSTAGSPSRRLRWRLDHRDRAPRRRRRLHDHACSSSRTTLRCARRSATTLRAQRLRRGRSRLRRGGSAGRHRRSDPTLVAPRPRRSRGWTGCRCCGRSGPASEVPVVVLTVRDLRDDKIAALDAGADDYVTKPFDTEELPRPDPRRAPPPPARRRRRPGSSSSATSRSTSTAARSCASPASPCASPAPSCRSSRCWRRTRASSSPTSCSAPGSASRIGPTRRRAAGPRRQPAPQAPRRRGPPPAHPHRARPRLPLAPRESD